MELSTILSAGDSEFRQLFSLFGIEGVEFLFLLINLLLFLSLRLLLLRRIKAAALHAALLAAVLFLCYSVALHEKKNWNQPSESLHVAFYQPGIVWPLDGNFQERFEKEADDLQDVDKMLSSLKDIDLFILPETFVFSDINVNSPAIEWLKGMVKHHGIPILSGGHSLHSEQKSNYNNIFLLNENGEFAVEYRKRLLMPIGEFKPFRESYPKLSEYLPGKNVYLSGGDSVPIAKFRDYKIALAICYEAVWKSVLKEFVDLQANFVVTVSSDNQFQSAFFAQNHLNVAASQALTMRLPLIRVTNTGISAAFDAQGNIVAKTRDRAKELKVIKLGIPKDRKETYFYRFEWLQYLATVVLIALYLAGTRWIGGPPNGGTAAQS